MHSVLGGFSADSPLSGDGNRPRARSACWNTGVEIHVSPFEGIMMWTLDWDLVELVRQSTLAVLATYPVILAVVGLFVATLVWQWKAFRVPTPGQRSLTSSSCGLSVRCPPTFRKTFKHCGNFRC